MSTPSAASASSASSGASTDLTVEADRLRPYAVATTLVGAAAVLVAARVAEAVSGYGPLLAVTLVLALLLAPTWPTVSGAASPTTTTVVLALASVAVVLGALRDDLYWIGAAVAFGIVLSFVTQLRRPPPREGLVLSLLSAFGGLVLVASGTTAVVAGTSERGRAVVVVAMVAVVAALLGDVLVRTHLPGPVLAMVALAAAAVAGLVVGMLLDAVGPLTAVLVGASVGAVSWAFRRVLARQPGIPTRRGQVGAGAGSLLAIGAIVHLAAILT